MESVNTPYSVKEVEVMKITNILMLSVFIIVALALPIYDRNDLIASGDPKGERPASFARAFQEAPRIESARMKGKKLIITGENFDQGAVIFIDGLMQKTRNAPNSSGNMLIAKKAGKTVALDQIVKLMVQNSNGQFSEELSFYTGCGS